MFNFLVRVDNIVNKVRTYKIVSTGNDNILKYFHNILSYLVKNLQLYYID